MFNTPLKKITAALSAIGVVGTVVCQILATHADHVGTDPTRYQSGMAGFISIAILFGLLFGLLQVKRIF